jgi:hypothetical protein
MSAIGTKQTSPSALHMSAFDPERFSARLFHFNHAYYAPIFKDKSRTTEPFASQPATQPARYLPARDRLEDELMSYRFVVLFALLAISELDADDRPQPGAVEQRGGPVSQDVKLPPLERGT